MGKFTKTTAIIYVSFFSLIGLAVWLTNSATPLWALILTPTVTTKSE